MYHLKVIFSVNVFLFFETLISDFTLADDFYHVTLEQVLPQRIHMGIIKPVSLTIQKLWPMFKLFVCKQTSRQTDRLKTICPSIDTPDSKTKEVLRMAGEYKQGTV